MLSQIMILIKMAVGSKRDFLCLFLCPEKIKNKKRNKKALVTSFITRAYNCERAWA